MPTGSLPECFMLISLRLCGSIQAKKEFFTLPPPLHQQKDIQMKGHLSWCIKSHWAIAMPFCSVYYYLGDVKATLE
ncbi:hypothetical protein Y1Q_0021426 [Alligator mississippiensis]|uniref:Uncharacterized protein n=1 Tax=Alligator mississippiensis TaxID=8496 RepID=A0A151P9K0_ALLMI|nr:hypothetical protein Y1Q_0021426 [Alligator mississippiensis]